mmetsp:Transcript_111788/g.205111  ORF Transcript_111788/g.205111 Transcript_111788/m.205111 type:complete len:257 (-) Transcript_111788:212-982(-)
MRGEGGACRVGECPSFIRQYLRMGEVGHTGRLPVSGFVCFVGDASANHTTSSTATGVAICSSTTRAGPARGSSTANSTSIASSTCTVNGSANVQHRTSTYCTASGTTSHTIGGCTATSVAILSITTTASISSASSISGTDTGPASESSTGEFSPCSTSGGSRFHTCGVRGRRKSSVCGFREHRERQRCHRPGRCKRRGCWHCSRTCISRCEGGKRQHSSTGQKAEGCAYTKGRARTRHSNCSHGEGIRHQHGAAGV